MPNNDTLSQKKLFTGTKQDSTQSVKLNILHQRDNNKGKISVANVDSTLTLHSGQGLFDLLKKKYDEIGSNSFWGIVILIIIFLEGRFNPSKLLYEKISVLPFFSVSEPSKSLFCIFKSFDSCNNWNILSKRKDYFIPNEISINNELVPDSFEYIIKNIITDKNSPKIHIIKAATGIGKTTFLSNLFLTYKALRKKSLLKRISNHYPPMLFISIADEHLIDEYIKSKRAKHTILILDALDEYIVGHASNAIDYRNGYVDFWKRLDENLKKFKKVILSEREQFELNIFRDFGAINLCHFTEMQSRAYIKKRFENNGYFEKIVLYEDCIGKGFNFINTPLILNFLEDLDDAFKRREISNLSLSYNLYEGIVNSWLLREVKKRYADGINHNKDDEAKYNTQLRIFCMKMAYKILTTQKGIDYCTKEELDALETDLIFDGSFYRNLGDRSLLTQEIVRYDDVKEPRYKFIHRSFLEFFLVSFIFEEGKNYKDKETVKEEKKHCEELLFSQAAQYSFAIEMLLAKRWEDMKKHIPLPVNNKKITKGELELLCNFFNGFSPQHPQFIKDLLTNNKLENILAKQNIIWANELDKLNGLFINEDNFWDKEQKAPCPFTNNLRFLRRCIYYIRLKNFGLIDEQLECFNSVTNLKGLDLNKNQLNGSGLKHFTQSSQNLEYLDLSENEIIDEQLKYIQGADKLKVLHLDKNQLNGSGLKHFIHSSQNLEYLFLSGNEIIDEHLKYFQGADKLKFLFLGKNQLNGNGLKHFTHSSQNLEILNLSENEIIDEQLKYFQGADKLKELYLDKNQLNGSGLKHFIHSSQNLEYLFLSGNEIIDEHLKYFQGADKLKFLFLGKNQLNGNGLKHFTQSSQNLEYLDLSENEIIDEQLKYFQGADKLKTLYLDRNQLNGNGLKHFTQSIQTLEVLSLWNNQITDEHLIYFEGANKLRELTLDNNQLNGNGLKHFTQSNQTLEELSLWNNQITDEHLIHFEGANKLRKLALDKNQLNGNGLQYFAQSSQTLEELYLSYNPIECKQLEYLVQFNQLNKITLRGIEGISKNPIVQNLKKSGVEIIGVDSKEEDSGNSPNYYYE